MTKRMPDEEADALIARVEDALDAPEPSPLFWEHFPARVRAAVASEAPLPAPARAWWRHPAAAFALAAVLVAGGATWTARRGMPASSGGSVAAIDSTMGLGDEGWAVVSSAAATAGLDALGEAGFGVSPGDTDAAIDELSDAERAAFVALLRAEMEGGGGEGI